MMCRIALLSLLMAGAVAQRKGDALRDRRDGKGLPSEANLAATLKHWHDPAPVTHLRGEFWELNRRLQSSKRHLDERAKEDAKKSHIKFHPDAQAVFVQEQADQQQMNALAGQPAKVTGDSHSNEEDTERGVVREPDLEGPGLVEESMERYNEGEDVQDDMMAEEEDASGVERQAVPVDNVDGLGWFVDDKSTYRKMLDDAVAEHRHSTVKNGRNQARLTMMSEQKKQEKKDEDKEDELMAKHLFHMDGWSGI